MKKHLNAPNMAGGLEPLLRMQAALRLFPFVDEGEEQVLLAWLEQMAFPLDAQNKPHGLALSATADQRRLTWWVTNERDLLAARLADLMEHNDLPREQLARLVRGVGELKEARLGAWISVEEGAREAGWYAAGHIPVEVAAAYLEPTTAVAGWRAWCQAHRVTTCSRLTISPGAGNPYTALIFPLPGGSAEAHNENGLDLFEHLSLAPDPQLAWLLTAEQPTLQASLWFSPTGLVKAGIIVPQPPQSFQLLLIGAMGNGDQERVAALEGTLGADSPAAIAGVQLAGTFDLELDYILRGEPLSQ